MPVMRYIPCMAERQTILASQALQGIDPLVIEACKDVDRSLLRWSLSLTPRQRLRACTRATRALSKFKRVQAPENG